MVTIELNEKKKDIVLDIESDNNNKESDINEDRVNEKCVNGCNLIYVGMRYICSFFNYYISKLCRNIKKCFE